VGLKCPRKIKHHLWRFAHNSLALRMELKRRGMELDTRCALCNRLDEDGAHLFFKCKHVWSMMGLEQHRASLAGKCSAMETMQYIRGLEGDVQMKVITLIWLWWQERNRVREGEKRRSAGDLAFIAASQATEYLSLYKHEEKNVVAAKQKWKRPGQEWLKVNSDGAFSADRGEGGWGVVIRDAEGGVPIAEAGRLPNVLNELHADFGLLGRGEASN
jgi:hypothetical protein